MTGVPHKPLEPAASPGMRALVTDLSRYGRTAVFMQGYLAGLDGRDDCPYAQGSKITDTWVAGRWRARCELVRSRRDRLEGRAP